MNETQKGIFSQRNIMDSAQTQTQKTSEIQTQRKSIHKHRQRWRHRPQTYEHNRKLTMPLWSSSIKSNNSSKARLNWTSVSQRLNWLNTGSKGPINSLNSPSISLCLAPLACIIWKRMEMFVNVYKYDTSTQKFEKFIWNSHEARRQTSIANWGRIHVVTLDSSASSVNFSSKTAMTMLVRTNPTKSWKEIVNRAWGDSRHWAPIHIYVYCCMFLFIYAINMEAKTLERSLPRPPCWKIRLAEQSFRWWECPRHRMS